MSDPWKVRLIDLLLFPNCCIGEGRGRPSTQPGWILRGTAWIRGFPLFLRQSSSLRSPHHLDFMLIEDLNIGLYSCFDQRWAFFGGGKYSEDFEHCFTLFGNSWFELIDPIETFFDDCWSCIRNTWWGWDGLSWGTPGVIISHRVDGDRSLVWRGWRSMSGHWSKDRSEMTCWSKMCTSGITTIRRKQIKTKIIWTNQLSGRMSIRRKDDYS